MEVMAGMVVVLLLLLMSMNRVFDGRNLTSPQNQEHTEAVKTKAVETARIQFCVCHGELQGFKKLMFCLLVILTFSNNIVEW
jgi:hypothetical protein